MSEAYFARLLNLPFVAVMPASTVREKCELIEFYGGQCHLVEDPRTIYQVAADLAESTGGYYLDQFTYAERATDWRGNNNIAETMFAQLSREPFPVPVWVVVGAGTGGTSATIGRHVRLHKYPTLMCVVDPEGSAFYAGWKNRDSGVTAVGSKIEGIEPAAGRAELRTGAGRSDDLGARRGIDRSHALVHPQTGPLGGRVDRDEHLGCASS